MSFKVDYSKATQRYNAPDGEYEVQIISAGFTKTGNGTEYISIKCQVRSDVLQEEQGEVIEYALWKSRAEYAKPSDIDGVPAWRIHQISRCAELPDGEVLQGVGDWCRAIQDKPLRLTVKADEQGRAKVTKVEASRFPAVASGFTAVDSDEPLPF